MLTFPALNLSSQHTQVSPDQRIPLLCGDAETYPPHGAAVDVGSVYGLVQIRKDGCFATLTPHHMLIATNFPGYRVLVGV